LTLVVIISIAVTVKNTLFIPTASLDLQLRYNAAVLLRSQYNPYIPHPEIAIGKDAEESYPPSIICMLVPLSFLSFSMAKTVWMLLNFLCTGLILRLLYLFVSEKEQGTISPHLFIISAALFLSSTPWRVAIANGQFTLIALAATLFAIFLSEKNKHILAGIILSVAMIKYPVTLFIPLLFLLRGKWLSVCIMAGIHISLTIAAGYWVSVNPIKLIWQSVIANSGNVNLGTADLGIFLGHAPVLYACSALIFIALFLNYSIQRRHEPMIDMVSVTFLMTLLLMYHRIYDFSVLIIPLLLCKKEPSYPYLRYLWIGFIAHLFFLERISSAIQIPYMWVQSTALVIGLLIFIIEASTLPPKRPKKELAQYPI